jgi:hypothetical protein
LYTNTEFANIACHSPSRRSTHIHIINSVFANWTMSVGTRKG